MEALAEADAPRHLDARDAKTLTDLQRIEAERGVQW